MTVVSATVTAVVDVGAPVEQLPSGVQQDEDDDMRTSLGVECRILDTPQGYPTGSLYTPRAYFPQAADPA